MDNLEVDGLVDMNEQDIEFAPNESELDQDGDSLILSSASQSLAPLSTPPVNGDISATPSPSMKDAQILEISHPVVPTIKRHCEFWFMDGSVVLFAQDTMFRVHKSFIARHSVIFRDMFSLPQPKADEPLVLGDGKGAESGNEREWKDGEGLGSMGSTEVEGCPVVHLHDSPEDVASLLYALYDGP